MTPFQTIIGISLTQWAIDSIKTKKNTVEGIATYFHEIIGKNYQKQVDSLYTINFLFNNEVKIYLIPGKKIILASIVNDPKIHKIFNIVVKET